MSVAVVDHSSVPADRQHVPADNPETGFGAVAIALAVVLVFRVLLS